MPPRAVAWLTRRRAAFAVVAFALVAGGVVIFSRRPQPARLTAVVVAESAGGFDKPTDRNPGYLGPQACRPCHTDRVAEFQRTRHYLANCLPQVETMPEGFDPGKGSYATRDPALRFEMTRREGQFVQRAIRDTPAGEQAESSRIAFVYGAGSRNDEVYFTWHGDQLFELPISWLEPLQQWGASLFDRLGTGDFSRDMTLRCVECHNTWFEHVPGTRNQYGHDNVILGVTCEVCHGPGREHVAFHQDQPQVTDPHAVVRPARLARDRQMDLCAQCHSNAIKHRGPAFSYRPGEPLEDFYFTLRTSHPEEDHVANQTTYLRQSKCFEKSDTLTCITCHNPHQPRSAENAGARSCLKCHASADCADQSHLPAAVKSNCVGCHMPALKKIQVYFRTESDSYVAPVTRYEHRIGIYPAARQELLLEWSRTQSDAQSRDEVMHLTRLLADYWLTEAERCRREYRYLAAINACRESLRFEPSPDTREKLQELLAIQTAIEDGFQDALWHERERRYAEAIESFKRILARKPDLAQAHARLGTTYAVVGQKQLAAEHLQAAAKCDPDDPYGPAMLGWLAYLDGRPEEALEHYRQAAEVEPYSAKINHQMGLALARLGRWPQAVEHFEKVVTIDPNNVSGCQSLSRALGQQGRREEALKYGLRAACLTHFAEPEILLAVADTYADLGRFREAADTATKALDAAKSSKHRLEAQIRVRLEEFRARERSPPESPRR